MLKERTDIAAARSPIDPSAVIGWGVDADPENDPERTRWQWRFPIRALAVVPDLHVAPAVEEAGIFPQSLWRHSHIRLTDEQFERARELVESAARVGRSRA